VTAWADSCREPAVSNRARQTSVRMARTISEIEFEA
jgi:hypothetical protein